MEGRGKQGRGLITYDIAYIGALDEEGAGQRFRLLDGALIPAIRRAALAQLRLQVAQLLHVIKVKSHIGRQDGADHQASHFAIAEGGGPVPPQDLRIGSAMKGFQDGPVIVQLGERGIEGDQEAIVHPGMADIVTDRGDEQRQGLEGAQELGDG